MEELIKAISTYITVSEDLKKDLVDRLRLQTVKKREILLREDEICTQSFFIQKGLFRLFYLKEGKEITEFFCAENQWLNSPKSFITQQKDVYYIQAIEDAEILSLHLRDLRYLFDNYPEMERYARLDMGTSFMYIMERLAISRFSSAQEKYQHFLTTYAGIHHRIPLGMAASYMGISQETLSRLRKQIF